MPLIPCVPSYHCIYRQLSASFPSHSGMASLAIQQLFPMQILLPFPRFKLAFIFQCYRSQTWYSSNYFFPALSISGTHKVPGIKFKGR